MSGFHDPVQKFCFSDGSILKIFQDLNPDNPRNWENMGTMVCFHKRYRLGDKHEYRHEDYANWDDMESAIRKREDVAVILPLYLYDHSGITISTRGFSQCDSMGWDWGQVGFIFVSKATVRKEYGVKRISKQVREKAIKVLLAEVEVYDQYLKGDVYGFVLEHDGEEDSCWGFYGSDIKENGIMENLPENLQKEIENMVLA